MDDPALVTRISDAASKLLGNPHLPLGLAEQQYAAVRRQPTTIKGRAHLLASYGWKAKYGSAIAVFGGCRLWHFLSRGRTGFDTYFPTSEQRLVLHSPTHNPPSDEFSGLIASDAI